jgi:hypothetical protein
MLYSLENRLKLDIVHEDVVNDPTLQRAFNEVSFLHIFALSYRRGRPVRFCVCVLCLTAHTSTAYTTALYGSFSVHSHASVAIGKLSSFKQMIVQRVHLSVSSLFAPRAAASGWMCIQHNDSSSRNSQ